MATIVVTTIVVSGKLRTFVENAECLSSAYSLKYELNETLFYGSVAPSQYSATVAERAQEQRTHEGPRQIGIGAVTL